MRRPEPEEILEWSARTGEPAEFRGSKVFRVLWEKRKVIPYHTVVKVIRAGIDVRYYFVNENGLLFEIQDKEKNPIEPKELLSKKKKPGGVAYL